MKTTLLACTLLLFSVAGIAQDQVKLQSSKVLLEGKILKADWATLTLRQIDGVNKKMAMDVVDSIFTLNDTIRRELLSRGSTKRKLKDQPLQGETLLMVKSTINVDTNNVADKATAKAVFLTQINQGKSNSRLVGAGNALNTSGTCMVLGMLSTTIGMVVLSNGSPKVSYVLFGVGGVLNLIGVGYLVTSGNILRGTKAKDLRVGIEGNGIELRLRF